MFLVLLAPPANALQLLGGRVALADAIPNLAEVCFLRASRGQHYSRCTCVNAQVCVHASDVPVLRLVPLEIAQLH